MSKQVTYYCDSCKSVTCPKDLHVINVNLNYKLNDYKFADLCPTCFKEFKNYLKTKGFKL